MSLVFNNQSNQISTSSGIVNMGDTVGALVLPKGSSVQRPTVPVSGMIRFNTSLNIIEIHNGISWGATQSSVTAGTGFVTSDGTTNFYKLIQGFGIGVNDSAGSANNVVLSLDSPLQALSNISVSNLAAGDILISNGTSFVNTPQLGLRNLFPAGDMDVNPKQYILSGGPGTNQATAFSSGNYFYADRCRAEWNNVGTNTSTFRQIVERREDGYSALLSGKQSLTNIELRPNQNITTTSANSIFSLFKGGIEARDTFDIVGRPFNVSFVIRTHEAKTVCMALRVFNGTNVIRSIVFDVPCAGGNQPEFVSKQIPALSQALWATGSINDLSLMMSVVSICGSTQRTATTEAWITGDYIASNTIAGNTITDLTRGDAVTDIQITNANVPMNFISAPKEDVWNHCYRYFTKSYDMNVPADNQYGLNTAGYRIGYSNTTTYFYNDLDIRFRVEMRTIPQVNARPRTFNMPGYPGQINQIDNAAANQFRPATIVYRSTQGFRVHSSSLSVGQQYTFHWAANADFYNIG